MFDLEALKQNELKKTENPDDSNDEPENDQHDPQFEPIVKLNIVETKTMEEDEDPLFSVRCKLYRFDTTQESPCYKERGVGILSILKHKETQKIRILMRREQTLKICANHYLNKNLKLSTNATSEKTLIWFAPNDYADEVAKNETLACRFMSVDDMKKFREAFQDAVDSLQNFVERDINNNKTEDELEKAFKKVTIEEKSDSQEKDSEEKDSPGKDKNDLNPN